MMERTATHSLPASHKLLLLLAVVLGGTLAIGALAVREPLLAAGALAVALMSVTMLVHQDMATLIVIFVLYTNTAVVAVRYHDVPYLVGAAVPALLIFPLAQFLVFRREKLIIDRIVVLMLFFLGVQLIGTLLAQDVGEALSTVINFVVEGLGLYFLLLNVVRTENTLRWAIWVLVIAGLLMGGLTFYQQVTQTYDQEYGGFAQVSNAAFGTGEENILGEVEQPRLAGPIGEVNRYAQTMLMLLPLALFRFWGEQSRFLRILAIVAVVFIGLGIALTFSRGAVVGLFIMLLIVTFMRYIKFSQLIVLLLVSLLVLQLVPQFGQRLTSLELFTSIISGDAPLNLAEADGSTRSRLTEMGAAMLVFVDHPIVGVGPGMFSLHYREYAERVGIRVLDANREAHSLFPGLAAEYGVLGLLSYLLILYITFRGLVRARRRWAVDHPDMARMATSLLLALITYLTTGIFLHMAYIRFFWLIMALSGALIHIAEMDKITPVPRRTPGIVNGKSMVRQR